MLTSMSALMEVILVLNKLLAIMIIDPSHVPVTPDTLVMDMFALITMSVLMHHAIQLQRIATI